MENKEKKHLINSSFLRSTISVSFLGIGSYVFVTLCEKFFGVYIMIPCFMLFWAKFLSPAVEKLEELL
jgi:hypothetical protein